MQSSNSAETSQTTRRRRASSDVRPQPSLHAEVNKENLPLCLNFFIATSTWMWRSPVPTIPRFDTQCIRSEQLLVNYRQYSPIKGFISSHTTFQSAGFHFSRRPVGRSVLLLATNYRPICLLCTSFSLESF